MKTYLPLLAKIGPKVETELVRPDHSFVGMGYAEFFTSRHAQTCGELDFGLSCDK